MTPAEVLLRNLPQHDREAVLRQVVQGKSLPAAVQLRIDQLLDGAARVQARAPHKARTYVIESRQARAEQLQALLAALQVQP